MWGELATVRIDPVVKFLAIQGHPMSLDCVWWHLLRVALIFVVGEHLFIQHEAL